MNSSRCQEALVSAILNERSLLRHRQAGAHYASLEPLRRGECWDEMPRHQSHFTAGDAETRVVLFCTVVPLVQAFPMMHNELALNL